MKQAVFIELVLLTCLLFPFGFFHFPGCLFLQEHVKGAGFRVLLHPFLLQPSMVMGVGKQ